MEGSLAALFEGLVPAKVWVAEARNRIVGRGVSCAVAQLPWPRRIFNCFFDGSAARFEGFEAFEAFGGGGGAIAVLRAFELASSTARPEDISGHNEADDEVKCLFETLFRPVTRY